MTIQCENTLESYIFCSMNNVVGVCRLALMATLDSGIIKSYYVLCKINLAMFDVTDFFDHLKAILDISLIQMTRTVS